jgi:hypothetical protein
MTQHHTMGRVLGLGLLLLDDLPMLLLPLGRRRWRMRAAMGLCVILV